MIRIVRLRSIVGALALLLALPLARAQAWPVPLAIGLTVQVGCPVDGDAVPLMPGQRAECELVGAGDRQTFQVLAMAGDRLWIQVAQSSGFGEPCGELRRGDGTVLTTLCEANNPRLEVTLGGAGPYWLTLFDDRGDDAFGYHLVVRRVWPLTNSVETLRPGVARAARLEPLGELGVYRYQATAGELLRFQLSSRSAEGEPCLELLEGEQLVEASCGGRWVRLDQRFATTGPRAVVVSDDNDDEELAYTLMAQRLTPLSTALASLGSWQQLVGRLEPVGASDLYALEGRRGDVFVLQAMIVGGVGSPCVELLRPDGSTLAVACEPGPARLETLLDVSGRHALLISAEGAEGAVAYDLAVARVAPPAVSAGLLERGTVSEGRLDGGADLDLYTFPALVDAALSIELTSRGGFGEPCFELRRPDGSLHQRACAARGETRIVRQLVIDQAGSQVLLIYDDGLDESLPYRLTLSVPEPSELP